jgi:hypothetical protein
VDHFVENHFVENIILSLRQKVDRKITSLKAKIHEEDKKSTNYQNSPWHFPLLDKVKRTPYVNIFRLLKK